MEEVRMSETIKPFIKKSFDGVQGRFIYMAWRCLFHIQEPMYNEFYVEFWAMVHLHKKKLSMIGKTHFFAWAEKEEN